MRIEPNPCGVNSTAGTPAAGTGDARPWPAVRRMAGPTHVGQGAAASPPPSPFPRGELIGARLAHAHIGHPVRAGRALLNTGDGTVITVTVPSGPAP
jgi:hypothetical protein